MLRVEIRVEGLIRQQWSERLGGLAISYPSPNETLLAGVVADQAALYGIISGLRDLGLSLASVTIRGLDANEPAST